MRCKSHCAVLCCAVLAVGPGPRLRGARKRDWPHLFRLSQPALPRFLATLHPVKNPFTATSLIAQLQLHGCCRRRYCLCILPIVVLHGQLSAKQAANPCAAQPVFLVRPIAVDASLGFKVPFTPQTVKKVLPGLGALPCTYSYRPCTSPLVPTRPFFLSNTALQNHQHRASKSFSQGSAPASITSSFLCTLDEPFPLNPSLFSFRRPAVLFFIRHGAARVLFWLTDELGWLV